MKKIKWANKELPGLSHEELNKITAKSLATAENGKVSGDQNVKYSKGIFSKGEDWIKENAAKQWRNAAKAKMVLTQDQAEEIRIKKKNGVRNVDLQKEYNISKSTIQRVLARTRY